MKKMTSYICAICIILSCFCISPLSAIAESTTYTQTIDFDTIGSDFTVVSSQPSNVVGSGVIDYTTVDSSYTNGNVVKILCKEYQDFSIKLGDVIDGKKIKSISYSIWSAEEVSIDLKNTGLADELHSTKLTCDKSFGFTNNIKATSTKNTVTYNFTNVKFEDYSTITNAYLRFKVYAGLIPIYIDDIVITYEHFSANFTGALENDRLIYANREGTLTTPNATLSDGEFAGWVTETDADTIIPANTQITLNKDETYFAVTNNRAEQSAPSLPVVESKTASSVTLVANSNYQFSKDGALWQESNVFNGLSADTEYTFYQRKKATPSLKVSPASAGLKVKTLAIFNFEAERVYSSSAGTYSGHLTAANHNDTGVGNLNYVIHCSSSPAVGNYVNFNFTGLTPGYYQVSIFSRNASSRSTYKVTAYDETLAEQDAGTINFADDSTKVSGTGYYCNPTLPNRVAVEQGSTLRLKFTISKAGTSGLYIDKFILTKLGEIEDPLAVGVSTLEGASIRLNEVSGIRFYTEVDQQKIDQLMDEGADVEMGTLIAPKDLLENSELTLDLATSASPKAVDVKYQHKNSNGRFEYYSDSGFNGIVGSIVNIKEQNAYSEKSGNITREFVARGYVKVTKGDDVTISYSDFDISKTGRSLKSVSEALLSTSFYQGLSDDLKSRINTWANAIK